MKNLKTLRFTNKYQYKSILFILLLLTFSCSFAQNPNTNTGLDNIIESEMSWERFPGASTIIVKDGKIVWVESYGYADVANSIAVEDTTVFIIC
tara:strand:- start:686 stop:967 length:282 start_codon:yes stop_codon:yes gene_type:complete